MDTATYGSTVVSGRARVHLGDINVYEQDNNPLDLVTACVRQPCNAMTSNELEYIQRHARV